MTVHPVAPSTRPRVSPRPRTRAAVAPAAAPSASASITVEVAVAGPDALGTATLLAGRIRDLVDAANADAGGVAAGGVDISASVGLEIGAGARTARSALRQVGRVGWAPQPRPAVVAVTSPAGPVALPAFVAPAPTGPAAVSAPDVPAAPVVSAASAASGSSVDPTVVPLRIYPARRVALLEGVPLQLTRREFDLLMFLSEHAGRVFDRPQLLRLVWGHQVICGERTVDVHIRRLRAKFEQAGPVISTVRGVGYRLDASERVAVVHEQS